ncbi:TPA: GAF domain-containing protein [Candidatus Poribacteria bacterium]|nr:GAF domain-containing protein [Candidatus Poribacteria bacterium]
MADNTEQNTQILSRYIDLLENTLEPFVDRSIRMANLVEILAIINSTLESNKLLWLIMESAKSVMKSEASSLMILDKDTGELIISVPTGPVNADLSGFRIPPGKGIAGWVARYGRPLAIPDVSADPRFYGDVDKKSGFQTRSIICVPMKSPDGEIIGVLQAINKLDGTPFIDEEISLFSAFADQAAIALENARLHAEELEKQRLEQELTLARQIQQRFWPDELPPIEGISVSGISVPAMQVGGDYYDFIPIGKNQLGMVVGDISGKGVSAALLMSTLRAMLRTQIENHHSVSDTVFLVNNAVFRDTPPEKYLTLFYCVLEIKTHCLTYVNAGHTPAFLYNIHSQEEKYLDIGGTLVGFLEDFPFQEGHELLDSGSVLLLYSDGVTDALNPENEAFGVERLHSLVRKNCHLNSKDLISLIYKKIVEFAKNTPQFDDITMIALKID